MRSRAEELTSLLSAVEEPTADAVAAVESLLVPDGGASERAALLVSRNAASDSSGLPSDEVVEVVVRADGVSGVARLKDYYRDGGYQNEALVDTDWLLVDGEWYRTLEDGRVADGPLQ